MIVLYCIVLSEHCCWMCFAAWFIAVQTLMTFAVVFLFLSLAVFPLCLVFPENTKWLWMACFLTAMISELHSCSLLLIARWPLNVLKFLFYFFPDLNSPWKTNSLKSFGVLWNRIMQIFEFYFFSKIILMWNFFLTVPETSTMLW